MSSASWAHIWFVCQHILKIQRETLSKTAWCLLRNMLILEHSSMILKKQCLSQDICLKDFQAGCLNSSGLLFHNSSYCDADMLYVCLNMLWMHVDTCIKAWYVVWFYDMICIFIYLYITLKVKYFFFNIAFRAKLEKPSVHNSKFTDETMGLWLCIWFCPLPGGMER